jgi:hypothetical protein
LGNQRIPTWEELEAAPPKSELEARARIVQLQREVASIAEQTADPLPYEERDREYRQWLAAAIAAKKRKHYEMRRLRIWIQEFNSTNAVRNLMRREAKLAEDLETASASGAVESSEEKANNARRDRLRQQVNTEIGDDLIKMGMALKGITKAWAVLIRVMQAAAAYVELESQFDAEKISEQELDAAFDALVVALDEAREKGYLPAASTAAQS